MTYLTYKHISYILLYKNGSFLWNYQSYKCRHVEDKLVWQQLAGRLFRCNLPRKRKGKTCNCTSADETNDLTEAGGAGAGGEQAHSDEGLTKRLILEVFHRRWTSEFMLLVSHTHRICNSTTCENTEDELLCMTAHWLNICISVSSHREKMICRILLLISLNCVCGQFTASLYDTAEKSWKKSSHRNEISQLLTLHCQETSLCPDVSCQVCHVVMSR